jgi:hypothetical protein
VLPPTHYLDLKEKPNGSSISVINPRINTFSFSKLKQPLKQSFQSP